ncbi:MAG: DEAD/DEAH box helicase [Dehalococcoidia bacterium]
MDTSVFLELLKNNPFYEDQIVHDEYIPPRKAIYGGLENGLHPSLQATLDAFELSPLYIHQADAVNLSRSGKNVIISTPSASGKTLCYNVPVLDSLLEDKNSRALYLFPTKALAQDQLRNLNNLLSAIHPKIPAATFDGDTPQGERAGIRKTARIILSNPDMSHFGLLPNHRSWASFFSQLRFVVIDEAHSYRGIFGSHVAHIIRRLRRICDRYGSNPRFICCSATIANPGEHAENLTGLPFEMVTHDGAPSGEKEFVCWNPPVLDEARSIRRSASSEATFLLTQLMNSGIRSLAFARTRKLVELIYIYVRRQLELSSPELADLIKPYRAGYLAEDRRWIERELFSGRLLATVATNALELGVDIGQLDATVLTGYPGSIASTWQQAGRSGRRGESSLSILIGSENPLDQYFMRYPEALFGREFEHALISPSNPHVLKPHLLCAAWEFPLTTADKRYFGDFDSPRIELEDEGLLSFRRKRWYPSTSLSYPAQDVNIRSSSSASYALVDGSTGQLLETIESETAFFQIHPGAVYLHQGEPFLVTELNLVSRTAYAHPADVNYYTQTKEITDLDIIRVDLQKRIDEVGIYLGEVEVTTAVLGFKKKKVYTEEVVGEEPLDIPPQSFNTVALWFDLPPTVEKSLTREGLNFAGGLHAAEHASIAMLPLFALCDRNDIGGVSTPLHPDTNRTQIFIYDAHPGGVGIAEKGFELIEALWEETLRLISECPCVDGCPSCVQSPKCGNNNQPLDKKAAQVILKSLLETAGSHQTGP